jgi:hypothetical protein
MTTPSNPSGIPSLPVVGLLAVILFLGLALAPRAFEFRAWPEQSRQYAAEEVVDRPRPEATPIEVAGVHASDSRRERALDVRGERSSRAPVRADERRPSRGSRRAETRPRGGRSGRPAPAPAVPDVVIETPAPSRPEPAAPAPEQPAQLAEAPSNDQVLRPEAPEVAPEAPAAPDFEVVGLDVDDADERKGCGRHRGNRGKGRGPHGH